MEIISFFLVAAVVTAIIVAVKRKKKKGKKSDYSSGEESFNIDIDLGAGSASTPVYKGPAPNVIYVFPGKRLTANCPYCDGENEINAVRCAICGEKIETRKRY